MRSRVQPVVLLWALGSLNENMQLRAEVQELVEAVELYRTSSEVANSGARREGQMAAQSQVCGFTAFAELQPAVPLNAAR